MGYYLTTEPENAVPAKSFASPKTHTPLSPVKERGLRFYQPETGRWISRDPIEELRLFRNSNLRKTRNVDYGTRVTTSEPTYSFVENIPVNRFDSFGLESAEEHCYGAYEMFLKSNPGWNSKVEAMKPKCLINFACRCCKNDDETLPRGCRHDGAAACTDWPEGKAPGIRVITIIACWNRQAVNATTIAHELSHAVRACPGGSDPCDAEQPIGSPKHLTCACARDLCEEMRAFYDSYGCANFSDCWDKVINSGYFSLKPSCRVAAGDGVTLNSVKDRLSGVCGNFSRTVPTPIPIPAPDPDR